MTDAPTKPPSGPAGLTPSSTVGPFFKYGLTPMGAYPWQDTFQPDLTTADTAGERVRLVGRVLDGDGCGVPDALLEIWQADAAGRYAHPLHGNGANAAFTGFGRADTGKDGSYAFSTVKPGAIAAAHGVAAQAPHVLMAIFARGMLRHLYTRIYFADAANADDPVLQLVPEARRTTLLAVRDSSGDYHLDIRLQGAAETVFFDL